jgi:uncharacterized protein with NAD-binding domain and iron-sulfur cluster
MTETKQKVAVLGGGVAGLTAAYELTSGANAGKYDVTVYQMGWRLGGKGASSRNLDPTKGMRIEEHGLHVWLGFYDNAFKVIQQVYAERQAFALPDEKLKTWRDGFMPQSFTPIGDDTGGKFTWWSFSWPPMAGTPGEGGVFQTPWQMLESLVLIIKWLLGRLHAHGAIDAALTEHTVADWVHRLYTDAVPTEKATEPQHNLLGLVERAGKWVTSFGGDHRGQDQEHHAGLTEMLRTVSSKVHVDVENSPSTEIRDLYAAFVIGCALARGMLSPRWGVLWHLDLDRVDHLELREWLIACDADRKVIESSSLLRALYDLAFAYVDGDANRPNFAAGTATRCILRIVFTYKESALFLMNSGMGEIVVAPMYEVLQRRGVKFELFYKVRELHVSRGGTAVDRIDFDIQALVAPGEAYTPTMRVDGLTCWPDRPFWHLLKDGEAYRDHFATNGSSFESHWGQPEPAGQCTLARGTDFDQVVLAISMGAFQKLNEQDRWMARELSDASAKFRDMLTLPLNPTMGAQLWMIPDLAGLGWTEGKPAMDAAPELMSVWADMSQELVHERWGDKGPGSVQYLCGVYPTQLYRAPATTPDMPHRAWVEVRDTTKAWFARWGGTMWPEIRDRANPHGIDWNAAWALPDLKGDERLDFQWLRPNVDPTECAVAAAAGTSRFRLDPGASGFTNLYLAGDWTSNGLNTLCVEAAVMSGMRAASCLSGTAVDIVGWDFLRRGGFHAAEPTAAAAVSPPSSSLAAGTPALPAYVSQLGHGEQSSLPPGVIEGGMGWWFAVRADAGAMQTLVDAQLNAPSGGKGPNYRVLGSHMLISMLDADRLTTPAEEVGYVPDQECGLWIPMLVWSGLIPRIVFWMPYIFINSSAGMCTGREVWGYPKEISSFVIPRHPETADAFVVNATVFRALDSRVMGTFEPIIQITRTSGAPSTGVVAGAWSGFEEAARAVAKELAQGGVHFSVHGVEEGIAAAKLGLSMNVPLANLKQFRDVQDPTRACYQAITEGPIRMDSFGGGWFLPGGYTLTITPAQSHQIVEDFGLASNIVPVELAFWMRMGFSAMPGKAMWTAP